MECNLYWYMCNCEDCNRAKELYELLEQGIDVIKELEDMGYSV